MTATNNAGAWLEFARRALAGTADQPGLEAQVLLASVLDGCSRTWLIAHPEIDLTAAQLAAVNGLLQQLITGTPLAYLTGRQEFYGLSFAVSPDVLIPRPETEILVERAIDWLDEHPGRHQVADIGTGSGCIAVSLSHNIPNLHIAAVDCSLAALRIARTNAAHHGLLKQVSLLQSDLLSSLSGPFDLICANLPYIPHQTLSELPVAHFEPLLALDGGPDGVLLIRRLLEDAPRVLTVGGLILLEIEYRQGQTVAELARQSFPDARVKVVQDYAGLDRIVEIHLQPAG
jgi:release factor glutamine methyltransferase